MHAMRFLPALALAAALLCAVTPTGGALAGDNDPLFVNVTTDESHRAEMALTFSKGQLDRHHPVTIFLNDRAVFLGSKAYATRFAPQQEMLAAFVKAGATVLICPMCMKYYGVKQEDLIEGIKVGNPDLTGAALFAEGSRSLSW